MKTYHLLIVAAAMAFTSCTKDADPEANISQNSLSSMATSQEGFVMIRASNSDNGGQWHIKMNDIAAKAYEEGCTNFPPNSMIIKEKHDAQGNVTSYGVMYRSTADANSSDGWVWTEFAKNGDVIYNASEMGTNCKSCHSQARSIIH